MEDAGRFEEQVRSLQDSWHERLGSIRRDSAARLLIESLPASPVLTVSTAAELLGRSFQAANQSVGQLMEADVLVQITVGRRNRAFEAPELIEAFTTLERQLASPEGDTRVSGPIRYVPRRQGGAVPVLVTNACLSKPPVNRAPSGKPSRMRHFLEGRPMRIEGGQNSGSMDYRLGRDRFRTSEPTRAKSPWVRQPLPRGRLTNWSNGLDQRR